MSDQADSLLLALVGEEMSSVIFVRDYVQLDFDGPRLSLFVWPQVAMGSEVRRIGDAAYRDTLCMLIGQAVVSVVESNAAGLVVDFGLGSVVVKPEPGELEGPEIAMLGGFTGRTNWMVWRPGESPFDSPAWSWPRPTSTVVPMENMELASIQARPLHLPLKYQRYEALKVIGLRRWTSSPRAPTSVAGWPSPDRIGVSPVPSGL